MNISFVPEDLNARLRERTILTALSIGFVCTLMLTAQSQKYESYLENMQESYLNKPTRMLTYLITTENHEYRDPGVYVVTDEIVPYAQCVNISEMFSYTQEELFSDEEDVVVTMCLPTGD